MGTDVAALVAHINAQHGTDYSLQGAYAHGGNEGAYALATPAGGRFVLKHTERVSWLTAVRRARHITDRLREHGVPVPSYVLVDSLADQVGYWVQTALPGAPPAALSASHAQQLLTFIDAQAGLAIAPEQNWSAYVVAVVFSGESGWRDALQGHNATTRRVLERLTRLTSGKEGAVWRSDDIVHGDLCVDNVLVLGETVTGIVDWDAAGCGDRSLDQSKLLFYGYYGAPTAARDPKVRRALRERIEAVSGRAGLDVLMSYNILAQLDWSIQHHPPAAVARGVAIADEILDELEDAP